MKPYFGRLRPSHDPALDGLVHIVNDYRGGLYSFASSHAANAFGVSFFLWLTVRKSLGWIWIMFIWATIFSYSRIYLGVHYPADIVVGALLGCTIAFMISELISIVKSRISR
jgi:undecaprenyl-diphosphatase